MKAPLAAPKAVPAWPSWEIVRSGGAALELASSLITLAASSPALLLMSTLASTPFEASEMREPPAPETRALIHTTYPSYLLACTATVPPLSEAALMIWSHVTGWLMSRPAFSTNDLRYQSTWVFDQKG